MFQIVSAFETMYEYYHSIKFREYSLQIYAMKDINNYYLLFILVERLNGGIIQKYVYINNVIKQKLVGFRHKMFVQNLFKYTFT